MEPVVDENFVVLAYGHGYLLIQPLIYQAAVHVQGV